MNCTFYRPETVNTNEFENIVGKLRYDLHLLETEKKRRMERIYLRLLPEQTCQASCKKSQDVLSWT